MPLLPIKIPPGIFRNGTQYQTKNRWFDGNLVRFSEGRMKPIGGWNSLSDTPFTGPIRKLHTWTTSAGLRWLAIGTSTGIFVWDGKTYFDITPLTVPGATEFRDLTDFDVPGLGYGIADYCPAKTATEPDDIYGLERPDVHATLEASTWHLDTFGDLLIGVLTTEGTLWEWDGNTANRMTQVVDTTTTGTNDPLDCTGVVVTPERHVVAEGFGGDGREIRWTSQGTLDKWSPEPTNTAGSIQLQTGGRIVCARRSRYGVLVFTTEEVYRMRFVGPPYVYEVERVAEATGPVGSNAVAGSADILAWMSEGRFWYFDGYVKPLPCDVGDYVFTDINLDISGIVCAGHNPDYSEIWWFYPTSGNDYNNRYVAWNYRENHWTIGKLERDVWHYSKALGYPIAAGHYTGSTLTGAVDSNVTGELNDSTATFVTDGVQVGDVVQNISTSSAYTTAVVNSVESETRLVISADIYPAGTEIYRILLTTITPAGGYVYRQELLEDDSRPARDDGITVPSNEETLSELVRVPAFGASGIDAYLPCYAESGMIEIGNGNELYSTTHILTDTDAGANGLQISINLTNTPDQAQTIKGPYALTSDGYTDVRFTAREVIMKVESNFDQVWRVGDMRFDANKSGRR